MKKTIKIWIKKFLLFLFSFRRIKKKVVFISFGGKQYSADPKSVSVKLHELYPEFEQVWVVHNTKKRELLKVPDYVRVVDTGIDMLRELSDSFAFVTTNPIDASMIKRKKQFFVQTWHGDRGMKKCINEAWPDGKCPNTYLDYKYVDIAVAGSDYGEDVYHKAFGYYGEISKIGMPRNDRLVFENINENDTVKESFGIPASANVLTYAPTFRDSAKGKQQVSLDIGGLLRALEMKSGKKWICLLRGHSASAGIEFSGNSDNIIDVSDYPDMADILLISDMLITDYSSCAGDYVLRKKPLILALFDLEEYIANCRDLRINFEESGYIIAKTNEEIIDIIENYTENDYIHSCEKVLSYYGTNETGTSAEYICNRIYTAYNDYFN